MQVLRNPTATGCQHLCVDAEEEEEEGRRSIASTRMQELVLLSLQAEEFGGFCTAKREASHFLSIIRHQADCRLTSLLMPHGIATPAQHCCTAWSWVSRDTCQPNPPLPSPRARATEHPQKHPIGTNWRLGRAVCEPCRMPASRWHPLLHRRATVGLSTHAQATAALGSKILRGHERAQTFWLQPPASGAQ